MKKRLRREERDEIERAIVFRKKKLLLLTYPQEGRYSSYNH